MDISIFGLGYVGCVSLGCLAKNGHNVIGVDVSETKVSQINKGLPTIVEKDIDVIIKEQFKAGKIKATTDFKCAILQTEISIIAVGTPSTSHGHLNLEHIFKLAEDFGKVLAEKNSFHVISIRSTVIPGTADKFATIVEEKSGKLRNVHFAMVSNPEFLREGTAVQDYYNPPLTLLGAAHEEAAKKMASLYKDLPAEIISTDMRIAEIMKYINNSFHALKISFANEVGNICTELGIDSHKAMEIFCKDRELNISPYYLKPGFAYGGSCLPKDLKGLQTLAHDLYIKTPVIDSISKTNDVQIQRAIDLIIAQKKRNLGFLGLSFKAGTDDLRNSPAVTVIEALIGKGYNVSIYDKNVQISRLTGTNKEYIDLHIPHLSKLMANNIHEVFDTCEVIIINTKEKEYVDTLSDWNGNAKIIDMVRVNGKVSTHAGYQGINW